jgi:hypothetical protein
MRKETFRGTAITNRTFTTDHRKNCKYFVLIVTEVHFSVAELMGNPRKSALGYDIVSLNG